MSARQRFLEQHDEAHEVSGIGSDGLRVTLRRFDNYDIAWAYSRRSKEKYTDLRVDTYGTPVRRQAALPGIIPADGADCGSCRNKLLWAGEAHCTIDNRRHRLVFLCKSYTGMSRPQVA